MLVRIDTARIRDWDSFHGVFAEAFGFPDFYGRNMDAWIDCLTYLDDPAAGMSAVHAPKGGVVTLQLDGVDDFAVRCPSTGRSSSARLSSTGAASSRGRLRFWRCRSSSRDDLDFDCA